MDICVDAILDAILTGTYMSLIDFNIAFTFSAFSRRFYPMQLTIITFVIRKINYNISLSIQ